MFLECGKSLNPFDPDEIADKIISGHNSSRGDFPWMVALYTPIKGLWTQICGGTLVSPNIVLTGNKFFNTEKCLTTIFKRACSIV